MLSAWCIHNPQIFLCQDRHGLGVLSCTKATQELCKLNDGASVFLVINSGVVRVSLNDESDRMKLAVRVHLKLIEAMTHAFAFFFPTKNV